MPVGKSTLLRNFFPNARVFTFNPVQDLYNTKADPNCLLPIEIKCKTFINKRNVIGLKNFMEIYSNCSYGAITYAGEVLRKVSDNIWLIPWNIYFK